MTPWIVLAVVLVAVALGYALASTRATRLDRRRVADGAAGPETGGAPERHPGSRHED